MNGLYIAHDPMLSESGISKKIISQKEGLEKNGVNMSLCTFLIENNLRYYYVDDKILYPLGKGFKATIKYYTVFSPIINYIKQNNISFVYIRYIHRATPFYIRFLKKLKKLGVIVFLEIPTYPYDAEHKEDNWKQRIVYFIERISRNQFVKCVDRIVTVQDYNEILGIPTIKISNGIDINLIPLRFPVSHQGYNLLGVANMKDWHGYDRLIEGLGMYYRKGGKAIINFYVVGDYSCVVNKYRALIEKYQIKERVHLEGVKRGKDLDAFFDIADLAIGSLGFHRIGLSEGKPLKCAEYAARGIPFIYSNHNSDFDDKEYTMKVPEDDSPIDIEKLLSFLNKGNMNPSLIRTSVVENHTWDYQMLLVVSEAKKIHD